MEQALIFPCAKGCEQVLGQELEQLGLSQIVVGNMVVQAKGTPESAYRVCLWSRVASRVLWVLAEGEANNPDEIYEISQAVDWENHLDRMNTFAVSFNGEDPKRGIRNTQFGALKIKDGLVDRLREKTGRRPNVDGQNPEISVEGHFRNGRLVLALDLSGGALHQRGYRSAQGIAPLKENLAATVLYRANWIERAKEGYNLIDPMCGSGTLLLEALLMAGDIAPALTREKFGFEHWLPHKPSVWKRLIEEAKERKEAGLSALDLKIWGFDANPQALYCARTNAEHLKLSHCLHFERREIGQFQHVKGYGQRGLIVSNPPYGERLGTLSELVPTYEILGASFKTFPNDWQMALISGNAEMLKRLKLHQFKTYHASNGGIDTDIGIYHRDAQPEKQEEIVQPSAYVSEQAKMFANRLRKNFKKALAEAEKLNVNAYRVYDQDMPEYAVAIDLYGDFVHIQEYAPPKTVDPKKARERLLDVVRITPEILGIPRQNVSLKVREKQAGKNQYEKKAERGEFITIRENEALLTVNLFDYLDTGLFLDHRAMRRRLFEEAKGKRFLNLFCYTASASVQAGLGGAVHTTSVDLSQTYLDWAHRNFDENQLDDRHRLIKADVMEWLNSGTSEFDLIFCDPPTFSNTKKTQRVFDVQRDHFELINRCMKRLAKDGTLYFSNNYRRFTLDPRLSELFKIEPVKALDFDFERRPNIHSVWRIKHLI